MSDIDPSHNIPNKIPKPAHEAPLEIFSRMSNTADWHKLCFEALAPYKEQLTHCYFNQITTNADHEISKAAIGFVLRLMTAKQDAERLHAMTNLAEN